MNRDKLDQLCQEATKKMDAGDFEGALNLTYQIRSLGPHYAVSHAVSGLLIDIGNVLKEEKIARQGIELLRKDFEAIVHDKRYAPSAYYNLANGYYVLFGFKKRRDPHVACFKKTELDQAKIYYRKVLSHDLQNAIIASETWVNLGNCFDELGRVIDALECYEKALELRKNHGMALANKGQALVNYAMIAGEHERTFLLEAYSLLSQALELGVHLEAASTFSKYLKYIRARFPDEQNFDKPPKFPGYTIKARSKIERFLIDFCLEKRLYLNICDFCRKCDAAIGDTAFIKKMITRTPNRFFHLSEYLNQIKQDYVTARFLLILSRYEGLSLNFVDKRVKIIDTLDYRTYNIYIQLVKTSFKGFYDILDKIACFINDYLELGIPERKTTFRKIWYSNLKTKMIHKKIMDTKNLSLNALFDIHRDFENGPYEKLKNTRHALTHRFVNIRSFQEKEDEENMTEEILVRQTLELARIVRSAIIYLLHFVYVRETKKEAKTKGILAPIFAEDLRDDLKARR